MKVFKSMALAVAILGQLSAFHASAQRYQDESPIGTITNAEVKALAAAFCQDNDYAALGYSSLQACQDGIFSQTHTESASEAEYGRILLPSGGQACIYYGSPGRLGMGSC
ncbi:hypothetical protein PIB19_11545 [Sphingomonas sp. 7/4-4]|uniref:hypothetical protein n=1 Tax=Sphingomonas sp. 7/4-4 TaxID=3018446 RepID=UPI0022F3ACBA|nr:hypothetical protein [Sphingomonas sp. 7/4-4]WBY06268.1 hypothetical protein PIB19_11545 [Sphingomonas sp. 7/4-4]